MIDPLLQVKNLCKYFPIQGKGLVRRQIGEVRSVDDVSFDLAPGETLGLVGESGCGKTTATRTILRALEPTGGELLFRTRDRGVVDLAALRPADLKPLRTEMQMIFQDPFSSLNPRMTVGEIVAEPLKIHNLARGAALREQVAEMLERVGLGADHLSRYPHEFSGGQRQRIGIARALVMNPTLVVADEAVSALDVSVQAQVINLLAELRREFQLTYIFVAHDLSVVRHICDRVAVMYAGKLVEIGPTDAIFDSPGHPYTRALIRAVPSPNPDQSLDASLEGEVADPANPPPGCAFHPRCPFARDRCRTERPLLRPITDDTNAACHFAEEIEHHTLQETPSPN